MNTPCTDQVVESVVSKLRQRSVVGVNKYKTTLADAGLSRGDLLNHLQCELMDASNYIEALIQMESQSTEETSGFSIYKFTLQDVAELQSCWDSNKPSTSATIKTFHSMMPSKTHEEIMNVFLPMVDKMAVGIDVLADYRKMSERVKPQSTEKPVSVDPYKDDSGESFKEWGT